MRVLLTGAAGFIGSVVADQLHRAGHDVVAVDALISQAHRGDPVMDPVRDPALHRVDVRDLDALAPLLDGVDVVCHQAAMVGAGVTVADLPLYAGHNDLGTATLLAALHAAGVRRLVLASSMVVYGEGRYTCLDHGEVRPLPRTVGALEAGEFDPTCPTCARPVRWALVTEDAPLQPRSAYAVSKLAQEQYAEVWARETGSGAVSLRYHNVYGPGMPRDTPYSGVAAIFRSALERGEAPHVFEDGGQLRDFVHVSDVARANVLAVELLGREAGGGAASHHRALNVCSGRPVSIGDVARAVAGPRPVAPVVTGEYRLGDVRHVVASPDLAREVLGFVAEVQPGDGLAAFATAPLR